VEWAKADRQLVDLDSRPFLAAHPRRRAPRQEFRVTRHVNYQFEELPWREAHDPALGVTGDRHVTLSS
jgi:hypothetical protein